MGSLWLEYIGFCPLLKSVDVGGMGLSCFRNRMLPGDYARYVVYIVSVVFWLVFSQQGAPWLAGSKDSVSQSVIGRIGMYLFVCCFDTDNWRISILHVHCKRVSKGMLYVI